MSNVRLWAPEWDRTFVVDGRHIDPTARRIKTAEAVIGPARRKAVGPGLAGGNVEFGVADDALRMAQRIGPRQRKTPIGLIRRRGRARDNPGPARGRGQHRHRAKVILDEPAGHLRCVGTREVNPDHLAAGEQVMVPLGDGGADQFFEKHRPTTRVIISVARGGDLFDALTLGTVFPGKIGHALADRRVLKWRITPSS